MPWDIYEQGLPPSPEHPDNWAVQSIPVRRFLMRVQPTKFGYDRLLLPSIRGLRMTFYKEHGPGEFSIVAYRKRWTYFIPFYRWFLHRKVRKLITPHLVLGVVLRGVECR